ncbi:S-adenosyl-L-methionine-dependent methyltransferase [Xylariales sp. AK1849]|nr:S-adenosyl-L-methionine-dependent methyltransferase [Xylariales sp. AK1849]
MAYQPSDAESEAEVHLAIRRDSAISAISYQSISTLTESVNPAVYEFVEENGRTYHSYKAGKYFLPNDRPEQARGAIEHQLFRLTLRDKLYLAPIEELHNVLDIGTGTGLWAFELAVRHPSAQVIGTDLSPIQPQRIPLNCQFEIDDAEDPWVYRQKFDLVHGRGLLFSFQSPETVVGNAAAALARNGWLEFQDCVFPFRCDDGSWEGTAMQAWNSLVKECMVRAGRRLYVEEYAQMFRNEGLVNVTERLFIWPVSPWPQGARNEHLRELGRWFRKNMVEAIEGISLHLMTRFGGLSKDEVLQLIENVKSEFWDTKYHVYVEM